MDLVASVEIAEMSVKGRHGLLNYFITIHLGVKCSMVNLLNLVPLGILCDFLSNICVIQ